MPAMLASSSASSSAVRRDAAAAAISRSSTARTATRFPSSDISRSCASAIASTTGSSRFHASRGWTVVPLPCSTRTRPRSSSIFSASRMTVRLKPNCSQSAGSVGRTSPSASVPLTIASASSSTTTEAKRAGRHGGLRSRTGWMDTQSSYGLTMTRLALGTGMHSSASAVDAAWALGIRTFDTAPFYRLGQSERELGAALAARPRDEYTLSTKVGRVPRHGEAVFDLSPDGIRTSFEESLERLRVDRVATLLLHDPEDHMAEAPRALEAARDLAPVVGVG